MTDSNNIINNNKNIGDDDYAHFINNLNKLPFDMINEIREFIPPEKYLFTNKENYNTKHHLIYKMIPKRFVENYIRDIVSRDNDIAFYHIIREKYYTWIKIKDYMFKNTIYPDYVSFIVHYCIMNESTKCKNIYYEFLEEQGITENQHKKNVVKHIRWNKLN